MPADALLRRMKNVGLFAGTRLSPSHDPGVPSPYTDHAKMYFSKDSNSFAWHNAKYASNNYAAQVQGVIPGTGRFEDIRGAYIRTMDIVEQSTGTQLPNDWQSVYFHDPRIQGLYTGAKLWFGGNTWLCTAPRAVASDTGNAVIRRCTAIWNYLDFYGNVKTEPFVWAKGPANATSNEYLDYNSIAHDYQKCAIQLNADTEQLRHNTRMILGRGAYQMSGIVDFISDFSQLVQEDGSTKPRQTSEPCHIMYFDLYKTEPLENLDDMEREIAGGLAFKWQIKATGNLEIQAGKTVNLGVYSLRSDADAQDVPVYSTEEHPITYLYASSDENIATVDALGNVTAISEGTATITVTLAQNTENTADFEITVTAAETGAEIVISPELPQTLGMQRSAISQVIYMENGEPIDAAVTMTASGPEPWCYTATLDGNTLTVNCWEGSAKPLEITLSCNGITLTRTITLRGLN